MYDCNAENLVREESPKALNSPNHTQLWNWRGREQMTQMARHSGGAAGPVPAYSLSTVC